MKERAGLKAKEELVDALLDELRERDLMQLKEGNEMNVQEDTTKFASDGYLRDLMEAYRQDDERREKERAELKAKEDLDDQERVDALLDELREHDLMKTVMPEFDGYMDARIHYDSRHDDVAGVMICVACPHKVPFYIRYMPHYASSNSLFRQLLVIQVRDAIYRIKAVMDIGRALIAVENETGRLAHAARVEFANQRSRIELGGHALDLEEKIKRYAPDLIPDLDDTLLKRDQHLQAEAAKEAEEKERGQKYKDALAEWYIEHDAAIERNRAAVEPLAKQLANEEITIFTLTYGRTVNDEFFDDLFVDTAFAFVISDEPDDAGYVQVVACNGTITRTKFCHIVRFTERTYKVSNFVHSRRFQVPKTYQKMLCSPLYNDARVDEIKQQLADLVEPLPTEPTPADFGLEDHDDEDMTY